MTDQRIVVVGGGIAGVSTAAALRTGGFAGSLSIVDTGEFPYDRPPLSKAYLSGAQDLKQIALQPGEWFDEQRIRLVNNSSVAAVRAHEGVVELSDGAILPADRVVLATGGKAARPPIPGADSSRVHVVRTYDDANRLRASLLPGARVLVVGAGLIGAEVASTAVELGCDVTLVDPVSVPLIAAVGQDVAEWLHGVHSARGIRTLATGVRTMTETAGGITVQFDYNTATSEFDVVVLGVGMVPDTGLAERAGLDVDRGIVVDIDHVTSNPAISAVGDPIRIRRDGVLAGRTEHWDAARRDGRRAAAAILGLERPSDAPTWFWTDRHGLHVEAVGHMAGATSTAVRGEIGASSFSVFGFRDGLVVSAVAVGDSNAVRAATRMIDRGIRMEPERIEDVSTDLRKLLRG